LKVDFKLNIYYNKLVFYPIQIFLNSSKDFEKINNLQNLKLLEVAIIDNKIAPLGIGTTDSDPYFYFSVHKGDNGENITLFTDFSTINYNGSEYKEKFIDLYFQVVTTLATELGGHIFDVTLRKEKNFDEIAMNPSTYLQKYYQDTKSILNKILENVETLNLFKIITSANKKELFKIQPILKTYKDKETYSIWNLKLFNLEIGKSLGNAVFNYFGTGLNVQFFRYEKIMNIMLEKETNAKVIPIIFYVPFNYFTENPEDPYHWKKFQSP